MINKDLEMIRNCTSAETLFLFSSEVSEVSVDNEDALGELIKKGDYKEKLEYPLDIQMIKKMQEIALRDDDDDYEMFRYLDKISEIWSMLISKAIKCLRYFDKREPFLKNEKKSPNAYGIDALSQYYKDYSEFEKTLYGSGKYYRDHVIHVFRTWLSGVACLVKNNGEYLENMSVGEKNENILVTRSEKLSIWTIIALTHDLGYPLEKAQDIINSTRSMISTFIPNPSISMDLSFQGVQNFMNDFIIRLMSSKMTAKDTGIPDRPYVARLQPKYYFKFQKSLERTKHGIISTLIIYKLLTYFLESDYNINEDYAFGEEDRRQFYIRREILRAMASHTCDDVYHLYMNTFSFLLIIADDTQEWGRKYISELYVDSGKKYSLDYISMTPSEQSSDDVKILPHICEIKEEIKLPVKKDKKNLVEVDEIKSFLLRLKDQCMHYITIFRDGQDTSKRDFVFRKICVIEYLPIKMVVTFEINNEQKSNISGKIEYSTQKQVDELFNEAFFKEAFKASELEWEITNGQKNKTNTWKEGEIHLGL